MSTEARQSKRGKKRLNWKRWDDGAGVDQLHQYFKVAKTGSHLDDLWISEWNLKLKWVLKDQVEKRFNWNDDEDDDENNDSDDNEDQENASNERILNFTAFDESDGV